VVVIQAMASCSYYNNGVYLFVTLYITSTNKTDHHNITEILLKESLNTITLMHCILQAMTKLSQKLADVNITDGVVSEVLRIFILARNGKPNEVKLVFKNKSKNDLLA
jgi:hypothetical protein